MLCRFAKEFPSAAGRFLDQAADLGRSFREETITDMLMGAMVAFRPLGIQVKFPNEQRTGADMEWIFVRRDGSARFHLLIQAKKIYLTGKKWESKSFPAIFHRVGHSGPLQSDVLLQEAILRPATFPLYMFYTNETICEQAKSAKVAVDGVSLASGHRVNSLVKQKLSGSINHSQACSLSALHSQMFPLSRLLCAGVTATPLPALPSGYTPVVIYFATGDGLMTELSGVPTPEAVYRVLREIFGTDVPEPVEGSYEEDARPDATHSRFTVIFQSPGREEERTAVRATEG